MPYSPPAFAKPLLRCLVPLYRTGLNWRRRRALLQVVRYPVPVISVGNLTVGGTGKTLFIPMLAAILEREYGLKVGVACRGYGGRIATAAIVESLDPELYGDEPAMLAADHGLFVAVARHREHAVDLLLRIGAAQCVLLDDGFQYWSIHRDLDILLWDATQLTPTELLPAGPLREPLSAISRAQWLGLIRVNLALPSELDAWRSWLASVAPSIPRIEFDLEISGRPWGSGVRSCLAVSGIANPDAFERLLKKEDLAVSSLRFPDHHKFTEADARNINQAARNTRADCILVTAKDHLKLRFFTFGKPVYQVPVTLTPSGDPGSFIEHIGRLTGLKRVA